MAGSFPGDKLMRSGLGPGLRRGDSRWVYEGNARDKARYAFLSRLGYRVLRFTNADVMENPEGVFEDMLGVFGEPGATGTDRSTPT